MRFFLSAQDAFCIFQNLLHTNELNHSHLRVKSLDFSHFCTVLGAAIELQYWFLKQNSSIKKAWKHSDAVWGQSPQCIFKPPADGVGLVPLQSIMGLRGCTVEYWFLSRLVLALTTDLKSVLPFSFNGFD